MIKAIVWVLIIIVIAGGVFFLTRQEPPAEPETMGEPEHQEEKQEQADEQATSTEPASGEPMMSPSPAPSPQPATAPPSPSPTPQTPPPPPSPQPEPSPPPSPMTESYTVEADDNGFYQSGERISSLAVGQGNEISITFLVSAENVYFGGLDFRGCGVNSASVPPGGSTQVQFTAGSSCTITSYWPASGVKKADLQVNPQ